MTQMKRMAFFERYLSVWVLLCMIAGVAIGKLLPGGVHQGIDNQLINPRPGTVIPVDDPQAVESQAEIAKTGRLGDMLNFYYKKAS